MGAIIMTFSVYANVISLQDEDEELLTVQEANVENCLQKFNKKGGTLIRLENNQSLALLPNDVVFPSCSGANNRSQTLYQVLLPYADKISLQLPHATRYGFDSYNGQTNWKRTKHQHADDQFSIWTGREKSEKFGWSQFTEWLEGKEASQEDLQLMHEYYSKEYYSPKQYKNNRRVYITFGKNAHIHLYRLCQTNESLADVVVLFYPISDYVHTPLPEWNTTSRSVKAYEELSKLIKKHLDFQYL